jgi:hypothetical protein
MIEGFLTVFRSCNETKKTCFLLIRGNLLLDIHNADRSTLLKHICSFFFVFNKTTLVPFFDVCQKLNGRTAKMERNRLFVNKEENIPSGGEDKSDQPKSSELK